MAILKAAQRNKMPAKEFGLPGKRAYPMPDKAHARNSLARASQFASPKEKAQIRRKVHALFPGIKQKAH